MRHRKAGKELSRNTSHRRAMLRNMVTSLMKYDQIETTDTKAKTIRPIAEKMITLAKRGDLHARRQVLSYMQDKSVTHRLFEEVKDRYLNRQGGYVRIVKKGFRKGDGAPVSVIQLLPGDEGTKGKKKKEKRKKAGKSAATAPHKENKEKAASSVVEKTLRNAEEGKSNGSPEVADAPEGRE
jgi:large subunit ribosomal protein L17